MLKSVIKDEIKVPGHIDYLGELRNFVTKTGKKYGFSDSIVNAFKLAIDEAATNIIKHAYRDVEGFITMRIFIKKNSMTVVLIDQGKYFDPARVEDPDLKRYVDIGKKGGLGIFIMRKLIDDIKYLHTDEGNELRLTKYKDGDFRKKGSTPIQTLSPLSASLKSRYSLFSAGILTAIVMIGYIYFYISHGKQILDQILLSQKANSENIGRTVIAPGDTVLNVVYINSHLNDAIDFSQQNEIYRILIIDSENLCIYSNDDEVAYTHYEIPTKHKMIRPDIYQYKTKDKNTEVFDIVSLIVSSAGEKVGKMHFQIKKDFVKKRTAAQRGQDFRIALLFLLIGYSGVAILIYLVMNPFRKLSEWVKQLGHGDGKDEIDFDTGNELGEIAKAFSDITDKFRESQKNLAEQERFQKEMQLAQEIQQTLLPTQIPEIEGYKIASYYEAARQVGGDYYDFVEVDKDSLGIVVADVSGKGIPGSLIMTMIRTALRTEARGVKSASEVLARLNDFVVKDMKKGMFVTLFYVIIDSKRRRLNYASAGHNPMILFRRSTQKTYYLNPKGFPVGISLPDPELFKKSIESDTIQLAEDDILLIYTDGITEAMNQRRELFGEERLLDIVHNHSNTQPQQFIEKLTDEILSFTQGFEQNDDITLVAIKEKSSPEKIELQRAQKAHTLILEGKNIKEACEESGITTYAYYNKYKKVFEEEGLEAYAIDETISVEAKHLSIEEKTKIYDIIKKHPEFGAKRISEELLTDLYGLTKINETKIYEELVRSRLNTRQLREAYVARAGKKKRMKPPGTPMLTLDGRIILDKTHYEEYEEEPIQKKIDVTDEEKDILSGTQNAEAEQNAQKDFDDDFYIESLMAVPIENLLDKKRKKTDEIIDREKEASVKPIDQDKDEDIVSNEKEKEIDTEAELSVDNLFDDERDKTESIENVNNPDRTVADSELLDHGDSFDFADSETVQENLSEEIQFNKEITPEKENEDEAGLEHDFSFKDLWEEADIDDDNEKPKNSNPNITVRTKTVDDFMEEIIDDDEISFEHLTDAEEASSEPSKDYRDRDDNGTYIDDNNGTADHHPESDKNLKDSFVSSDDETKPEEIDRLAFSDLLDEIEQDISFLDGGVEVDDVTDEKMSGFTLDTQEVDDKADDSESLLRNEYLLLGLRYYRNNEYEKAIEQFKKVLETYPDFKEVHTIIGNAYFKNDMNDEAMKEYRRVIEIDPYDVDAYENLGILYANSGDYSQAISEWEKLLKIDPDRIDIKKNVEKARTIMQKSNDKI